MSFSCPLEMEVVKCESIFSNIWLRFCYEYETTFESDINKRENNQCRLVDNFCRKMSVRGFQQSPSRSPGLLLRPHWKSHFSLIWNYSTNHFFHFFVQCQCVRHLSEQNSKQTRFTEFTPAHPKWEKETQISRTLFALTCPWLGTSTPPPPAFPPMRSPVSRPPEHHQYQHQHQHPSSRTSTK